MKMLRLFSFIFFVMTNIACNDEETPQGLMNGSIECDVDGQPWKATNTVTALKDFEKLTIIGRDGKEGGIALYIPNSGLKAGTTIELAATGKGIIVAANKFTKTDGKEFYVMTGTITINNATTNKAEGTFNFQGGDNGAVINIDKGKFSVDF